MFSTDVTAATALLLASRISDVTLPLTVATPFWFVISVCRVTVALEPASAVVAAKVPHCATCTGFSAVNQTWR